MAIVILLDSDVLIAHLRGREPARRWLLEARGRGGLATSAVSLAEVTGGMRDAERREVTRLLSSLQPVVVDALIGYRAGELRRRWHRSHSGIGLADYVVAATAETYGLELATLNVRHFPMFRDLSPPFAAS